MWSTGDTPEVFLWWSQTVILGWQHLIQEQKPAGETGEEPWLCPEEVGDRRMLAKLMTKMQD